MTDESEVKIRIRDLNLNYKDDSGRNGGEEVVALKNINLDIPKNKLTAIIGPSGCGKSTLLKVLNRLHDIRHNVGIQGNVYLDDDDIYHPKHLVPELRRKIGLVSQKPFPLPSSIFDNVAYGPRIHGTRGKAELAEIVADCLKKAQLWDEVKDRMDSPAAKLSVGQQQRLCVARALAVEPEVLLCDEITSALDPISSKQVEDMLVSIKKEYTIILVSHVLRQARRLADQIVFMYLGEVVEASEKNEFFNNPKDERSKDYIHGIMPGT